MILHFDLKDLLSLGNSQESLVHSLKIYNLDQRENILNLKAGNNKDYEGNWILSCQKLFISFNIHSTMPLSKKSVSSTTTFSLY